MEAALGVVGVASKQRNEVFDKINDLIPSELLLVFRARALKCFDQKLDDLLAEVDAVDIHEFDVVSEDLRGEADEIEGLPINFIALHLHPEVVLHR